MSCRHTETTTTLWLYGEGPEDHDQHVADCEDCQAAVAEHESVAGDIADILPALRRPEDEWDEAPAAANNNRIWIRWVAIGAAAVAVLAGLQVLAPVDPEITVPEADADAIVVLAPFYGEVDEELDDLDYLVDSLAADRSIL